MKNYRRYLFGGAQVAWPQPRADATDGHTGGTVTAGGGHRVRVHVEHVDAQQVQAVAQQGQTRRREQLEHHR